LGVFLVSKQLIEEATKILAESIRYKTVLGESYEEMVDYYREVLSHYGIHVTMHRVPGEYVKKSLPRVFNPDKPRYILFARIGYGARVLQLNGHYDVVPSGAGWPVDPFEPRVVEGRLYGRGSSDMKGGIAAILATLIHFSQTREPEVILEAVLVPDGEIGGSTGTGYLVRELGSRPDFVLIAEPSRLSDVYVGHRGYVWALLKVHGSLQSYAVTPLVESAFENMLVYAKLFIDEYRSILSRKVSSFTYDEPESSKPSITVGGLIISSGAINAEPSVCCFSVNRELVLEEKTNEVIKEIERLVEDLNARTGIKAELEIIGERNPVYAPLTPIYATAFKRPIARVLGFEPRFVIASRGLDLGYYAERGIPAVAYGPGSPGVSHKPGEYIELDQLAKAINVYIVVVNEFERSLYSSSERLPLTE